MERKEFLKKVLAYGRQAGFADCEVYYRGGKAFEVLILEGEVSDYENSREEGLAFRGNINGRTGYAYTEQLTEDAIAYLVETAKEMRHSFPRRTARSFMQERKATLSWRA